MNGPGPTASASLKEAAEDLRAAVHELAARAISVAPDVGHLGEAAELVRQATARIDGDDAAPRWDGPATSGQDPSLRHYRRRSVFQGELHPFSPTLRWAEGATVGEFPGYTFAVTLPRLYGGPPGAVHGGYIAGLFDELLGAVQALATGGGGYTGRLTVRYRSLTPIDEELTFQGWITADTGRRIETKATCTAGTQRCADAHALFVRPAKPGV